MFKELVEVLTTPIVLKALFGYWVISALIGSLPSPQEVAQYVKPGIWFLFYRTFFGFAHLLGGNLSRAAVAIKIPGAKEMPDDQAKGQGAGS